MFSTYIQAEGIQDFDGEKVQESRQAHQATSSFVVWQFERVKQIWQQGVPLQKVAGLLRNWFDSLQLREYKKVLPLAHAWHLKAPFFMHLLGDDYFNIFHDEARDIMNLANHYNDVANHYNTKITFPYPKVDLQYMCNMNQVERMQGYRDAIEDCEYIRQLYVNMVHNHRSQSLS